MRTNAVFFTEVVFESKMVREMKCLCFTIETAVGGCEGRRCETTVAAMLAYGRIGPALGSVIAGGGQTHCNGGFKAARVADGGAVLLGNGIAGDDGGAVLLTNVIERFHGVAVLLGNAIHCSFPWRRGVIREWNWRFSLWCGVICIMVSLCF